jgi:hypothetical protein
MNMPVRTGPIRLKAIRCGAFSGVASAGGSLWTVKAATQAAAANGSTIQVLRMGLFPLDEAVSGIGGRLFRTQALRCPFARESHPRLRGIVKNE